MKQNKLLCLDTNIFIYYFQAENEFGLKTKKLFELLVKNKAHAVTSIITQIELLSLDMSPEESKRLYSLFLETPHLKVENLVPDIANEAAKIRREYDFRTPDAIQLATAVYSKADAFITNDRKLLSFKGILVQSL